jgi:hypothetical protein
MVTYEGIVENHCVRLPAEADVPEKSKVYVLVPDPDEQRTVHIYSPRLSDPSQAAFFELKVTEEGTDAPL